MTKTQRTHNISSSMLDLTRKQRTVGWKLYYAGIVVGLQTRICCNRIILRGLPLYVHIFLSMIHRWKVLLAVLFGMCTSSSAHGVAYDAQHLNLNMWRHSCWAYGECNDLGPSEMLTLLRWGGGHATTNWEITHQMCGQDLEQARHTNLPTGRLITSATQHDDKHQHTFTSVREVKQ